MFAREIALASGQPWVWWHEDDFVLNGPTDLAAMRDCSSANPHLQQVALLRQPWWQGEIDAGSIIAERPDGFTERDGYVEHALFWTQNPHLVARDAPRRAPVADLRRTPKRSYSRQVLTDGRKSRRSSAAAYDLPRVTHVGDTSARVLPAHAQMRAARRRSRTPVIARHVNSHATVCAAGGRKHRYDVVVGPR
jgi:hypothetical protein